jgi:gliding motility-associated-like protein
MDDSINFVVSPLPDEVCLNSTAQYINQSTGGVSTSYSWTLNNAQQQSTNTSTFSYTDTGRQVIKLLASNRCGSDSISYVFRSKPLPAVTLPDTIIMCPGNIRTVFASGDFDSVFWNTGAAVNPTEIDGSIAPVIFKGYKIGCYRVDSINLILDCEIYIPTAFSPNNDGLNDLFGLMPINISTLDLRIFNRWGELVFETSDLAKGWDGTYKGQPCQMDNYVYYATGVKKDNKSFSIKGSFLLLR